MTPHKAGHRLPAKILGAGALASGAALVTHILSGISLGLAIIVAIVLVSLVIAMLWKRIAFQERRRLATYVKVGFLAGCFATASYDTAKFALSQLDPSPYNPFEAIRIFGILLANSASPTTIIYATGTAFHFLNGITFGIAFCLLFKRHSILTGIFWGIILELFQLTLFPGWLDIRFYQEFIQISALSHIIYGVILGLTCQYLLKRHASEKEVL